MSKSGYHIDKKNNTVSLHGEVDVEMYNKVLAAIHVLGEADYITYVINTEGGDLYQGLAIYDLIKSSGIHSKMVCCGPVMSAGTVIMQAGHERLAYPNAHIMIHYGEDSNSSESDVRQNAKLLKVMKDIVGKTANVKKRTLNSWFNKDTYFDAKQALKAGLIDRIIG